MNWLEKKKIHFIGIGGVGVNALARFALENGAEVSGSDAKINSLCREMEKSGARIYQGEDAKRVDGVDLVVFSSAIKDDNAELSRARDLNIPTLERQDFLHCVSSAFSSVVGIAGTHGKTTTTAMLVHILSFCKKSFVGMIGGESVDFGNYVNNNKGDNDIFVVEACEYKRNFLTLKPTVALVTNVECDHPDCYADFKSVREAFDEYLSGAAIKIYALKDGELDGFSVVLEETRDNETSTVFELEKSDDGYRLFADGISCGILHEYGDYNYKNATFAIAAAFALGVSPDDALSALCSFSGVKRRFEYAGRLNDVPTYFDFAHHPTEIECVLKRAQSFGKMLVVFQPHTYSRTKAYLDGFVNVLGKNSAIGTLVIMPTYAARENPNAGIDSSELTEAIKNARNSHDVYLANDEKSVLEIVKKCAPNHDVIVFVGAGDIYDLKSLID